MEYAIKKERLYCGGNECLRYRLEYPLLEKYDKINAFLDKMIKNCEDYCKGELYGIARQGKDKYTYFFTVRVTHRDTDAISAVMVARLLCNGDELGRFEKGTTWDTKTELMMPPKMLCRRYGKRGDSNYRKKDVLLKNGELVSVSQNWDNGFVKKQQK